ncbi:MAG: helix-turn-helix domain-containing protein [Janthinobacterium lividum]
MILMRASPPSKAKLDVTTDLDKPAVPRGRPKSKRTPELEIALGVRIRAARVSAGLSQTDLGAAVGISFQQVQKYEKGSDRVAASTLQVLATVLGVNPGSFYDDAPIPTGSIPAIKAAFEAAGGLHQIRDPLVRRQLLALIKTLAERERGAENGSGTEHPLSTNDEPR